MKVGDCLWAGAAPRQTNKRNVVRRKDRENREPKKKNGMNGTSNGSSKDYNEKKTKQKGKSK